MGLEVAVGLQIVEIAVNEIGLKRDGIIAILMQTSVIDGYQTIEDIQQKYGDSIKRKLVINIRCTCLIFIYFY